MGSKQGKLDQCQQASTTSTGVQDSVSGELTKNTQSEELPNSERHVFAIEESFDHSKEVQSRISSQTDDEDRPRTPLVTGVITSPMLFTPECKSQSRDIGIETGESASSSLVCSGEFGSFCQPSESMQSSNGGNQHSADSAHMLATQPESLPVLIRDDEHSQSQITIFTGNKKFHVKKDSSQIELDDSKDETFIEERKYQLKLQIISSSGELSKSWEHPNHYQLVGENPQTTDESHFKTIEETSSYSKTSFSKEEILTDNASDDQPTNSKEVDCNNNYRFLPTEEDHFSDPPTEDESSDPPTEEDQPSDQTTKEDRPSDQTTEEDQPSDQTTEEDQPSDQSTEEDQSSDPPTEEDQPSNQSTEDHSSELPTEKDHFSDLLTSIAENSSRDPPTGNSHSSDASTGQNHSSSPPQAKKCRMNNSVSKKDRTSTVSNQMPVPSMKNERQSKQTHKLLPLQSNPQKKIGIAKSCKRKRGKKHQKAPFNKGTAKQHSQSEFSRGFVHSPPKLLTRREIIQRSLFQGGRTSLCFTDSTSYAVDTSSDVRSDSGSQPDQPLKPPPAPQDQPLPALCPKSTSPRDGAKLYCSGPYHSSRPPEQFDDPRTQGDGVSPQSVPISIGSPVQESDPTSSFKLAVQATSLPKQYSWTTYHTSLSVPSHSPGSDMLMVLPHHTAPAFSGPYHPRPPECSASSLGSLGCARLPHRTAPAFSGPYHPRPPEYSASSLGSSGCARQPDSSNSTTETHFGSNPVQEVNLNPSSILVCSYPFIPCTKEEKSYFHPPYKESQHGAGLLHPVFVSFVATVPDQMLQSCSQMEPLDHHSFGIQRVACFLEPGANTAHGRYRGLPLQEVVRIWAEENRPCELQQLNVALIRYMLREGRGLRCLRSAIVEEDGAVSIPDFIHSSPVEDQLQTLWVLVTLDEEFLFLYNIYHQDSSLKAIPLQRFLRWFQGLGPRPAREDLIVLLEEALTQLEE